MNDGASKTGEADAGDGACGANAEVTGGGNFAHALAMIARLPMSDAEKAQAVRRLLAECGQHRTGETSEA